MGINGNATAGAKGQLVPFDSGTGRKTLSAKGIVPCFTPGTLIATQAGEVRVEDLRLGDRVVTRDNGLQPIRWIGTRALTAAEFSRFPHLRPVLVQAGALGAGGPDRDMLVSPNHRFLVANERTAMFFEDREVLIAAKHLTREAGVDQVTPMNSLTYLHLMFEHHEVILSDGIWSESFQPGEQTLAGLDRDQRQELLTLFPGLRDVATGETVLPAARRHLKGYEAAALFHEEPLAMLA